MAVRSTSQHWPHWSISWCGSGRRQPVGKVKNAAELIELTFQKEKVFKAFFKQEGFERDMTEKITSIKIASDQFAEAAKVCSYQKQDAVHRDVRQNSIELRTNRLMIERSMSESAQQHNSLSEKIKAEGRETCQELETRILIRIEGMLRNFLSADERIDPKTNDRKCFSLTMLHQC